MNIWPITGISATPNKLATCNAADASIPAIASTANVTKIARTLAPDEIHLDLLALRMRLVAQFAVAVLARAPHLTDAFVQRRFAGVDGRAQVVSARGEQTGIELAVGG